MTDKNLAADDLCLPVYLNQQIVFDLLAILKDGFSDVRTVKNVNSDLNSQSSSVSGGVGIGNFLELLGVSVKADASHNFGREGTKQTETSEERVHTPASLFSSLRLELKQRELIRTIDNNNKLDGLESGEFVEFRARLQKNPLIETLNGIKQLMELFLSFSDFGKDSKSQTGGGRKNQGLQGNNQNQQMKQIEKLIDQITKSNTIELIGKISGEVTLNSVISIKPDYLISRDTSEIIDGEFSVLGKISRVVKIGDEPINLLRNTTFSLVNKNAVEKMMLDFEQQAEAQEIFSFPKTMIHIESPAIQVSPVAIFL